MVACMFYIWYMQKYTMGWLKSGTGLEVYKDRGLYIHTICKVVPSYNLVNKTPIDYSYIFPISHSPIGVLFLSA